MTFDWSLVLKNLLTYLVLGLAIAVSCFLIPGKKLDVEEILLIALIGGATLSILDLVDRRLGHYSRMGIGLVAGSQIAGGVPTSNIGPALR